MTLRALIHSTVDHSGRHTHPVWIYDIDKPRAASSSKLASRYAAVKLLDVFSTYAAAEAALEQKGIPLLTV